VLETIPRLATSRLDKIVAGLFFVTVALAAPAYADADQDMRFYRLLTDPDQDHPMVIWNFSEVRSEGIAACQREDAGEPPYQATKDLERPRGPYTFDNASSITSSAETIYCPWHGPPAGSEDPSWLDAPAPVSPRPVYPPIEWFPPVYYPPGGGY
jgi:hypothetical protein